MDDKSTPLESLNNNHAANDESQVVNNILNKYNNLQQGNEIPPQQNIQMMEKQFENRDMSNEVYNHSAQNIAYQQDYQREMHRSQQYQNRDKEPEYEYEQEEDYDEYEIEEVPMWKQVVNEIRIPLFVFLMVLVFFNKYTQKTLVKTISFFGDQFHEINNYGFVLLALLVAVSSYVLIRFARV